MPPPSRVEVNRKPREREKFILSAICGYLILGLSWIFFSDRLLLAFTDIGHVVRFSTAKGVLFILVTVLFLFFGLAFVPDRDATANREPNGIVTPPPQTLLSKWAPYIFAAAITVAMLYLRMLITVSFGNRPLLILFVPPIILSSMLGGMGPGLFATAVASLGIDYYGIPPTGSFTIEYAHDAFQWSMLIVTGVLSSVLSEFLIRARRQAEERRALQEIAREKLRLSEERFQLAMRGSNDGLWDWDLRTDTVYYSPRWKAMLGYGEDDLENILETGKRLIHPDDLDRTFAQIDDLVSARSDRLDVEFRMRHRDGTYRDILSRAFPATDDAGNVVRLVGTHADVTERRQSERLLRERESLLDKTGRIAQVGGWGFDVATGHGAWTDETARIHDLDPSDPTSAEIGLSFFHGEHRRKIERAVLAAIERAEPYDLELEMISAKGIRKWVRTIGQPKVQDGRVTRLEGIIQDISLRKKAELEILALNADLERRVEERTAELTAANAELESFSYAVSHDLRAPLRAMSGFSQALLEDYGDRLDGEAKTYLEQIVIGSRRMGELIDGLLKLSRSTRSQLQPSAVNLSEIAERLLRQMAEEEPERKVHWKIEPDLICRGDATMLEAVLGNLLGNAWKYTSQTGEAAIRLFSENDAGKRWFRIEDNGAGFDQAYAAKLFEPFQRLHRQEEFPGLGIGLATANRIIRRLGGTMNAEGTPGTGAVFRFTLPE